MNIDDFFAGLMGDTTPAIATVCYGNRAYDDALIELRMRLEGRGFVVNAAACFVGEHTFSSRIATGRPDGNDLAVIADFGKQAAASIARGDSGALGFTGVYPFVAKGTDLASPSLPTITTGETCAMCGRCAQDCSTGQSIRKTTRRSTIHSAFAVCAA